MAQDNLSHIKEAEDKLRDAIRLVILIEPKNGTQTEIQEDFIGAVVGIQNTESLALRRAFE